MSLYFGGDWSLQNLLKPSGPSGPAGVGRGGGVLIRG